SLNNLSLMSLTIATGFAVDDAIVMIENISRYLEEGEDPFAAALKGATQIGFTIISLTISLIAVLIPLLFMSDVVGRLFRDFAATLATTILISPVAQIPRDARNHDPDLGRRVADAGADDVRTVAAHAARRRRGEAVARAALLRPRDGSLRPLARVRHSSPGGHARRGGGDARRHRIAVRRHPEGPFPDAAQRSAPRPAPRSAGGV